MEGTGTRMPLRLSEALRFLCAYLSVGWMGGRLPDLGFHSHPLALITRSKGENYHLLQEGPRHSTSLLFW